MAGQIRMTPDQMRLRAGQYKAEAKKVDEVIRKMDSLLAELQGEWEGKSFEAYFARYQELKPSFIKVEELIEAISDKLISNANALEQTDEALAR